jgi:hypothetical protein
MVKGNYTIITSIMAIRFVKGYNSIVIKVMDVNWYTATDTIWLNNYCYYFITIKTMAITKHSIVMVTIE